MFTATSEKNVFSVDGVSTDSALVQAIGAADKPKGMQYVAFSDGTFAVVKGRNFKVDGLYIVRAVRGSNAPKKEKETDPLVAAARLDAEHRANQERLLASLNTQIEALEAEVTAKRAQYGKLFAQIHGEAQAA